VASASCSTNVSRSATACASAPGKPRMGEKELSERIDALESRLAYQDQTIEQLNETITAQWKQIDTLTRQLAALTERLQEAEANVPSPANERPPHY
jgi:SlyX protein